MNIPPAFSLLAPSAAFIAASTRFVPNRFSSLYQFYLWSMKKATASGRTHSVRIPSILRLAPWPHSWQKRASSFLGGSAKGCDKLACMLSLFSHSSEPCTPLARVFPAIPLLLLSIIGFRGFDSGISISSIYIMCILFFFSPSRLDVTFTINGLVGSNLHVLHIV